MEFDL